jgi:hypothetical protein
MEKLKQNKFALASGLTSVVIYLGCFLTMSMLGRDALVKLSNLLFHGMDFNTVIRMNIPIGETLLGGANFIRFMGCYGIRTSFSLQQNE